MQNAFESHYGIWKASILESRAHICKIPGSILNSGMKIWNQHSGWWGHVADARCWLKVLSLVGRILISFDCCFILSQSNDFMDEVKVAIPDQIVACTVFCYMNGWIII